MLVDVRIQIVSQDFATRSLLAQKTVFEQSAESVDLGVDHAQSRMLA